MFGYYLGYGGLGVWGWIVSIAFVALLVFTVMSLVHLIMNSGQLHPAVRTWGDDPHGVDPAMTELRVRYARGDISWDEYLRRSSNLGAPVTAPWQGQPSWPHPQGAPGPRSAWGPQAGPASPHPPSPPSSPAQQATTDPSS